MSRPVTTPSDRTWNQLCNLDDLRILCQHLLTDYDQNQAMQAAANTYTRHTLEAIRDNVLRPATERGA